MLIPESLVFNSQLQIKTIYLFLGLSVLMWYFMVWYESLKDGFDLDKMFDISFWIMALGGGTYWILNNYIGKLMIFNPTNWLLSYDKMLTLYFCTFVVSLIPIFIFSKLNKWSIYRLLDIFSLAYVSFVTALMLGDLLLHGKKVLIVYIIGFLIYYIIVLRYRSYKILSGFIFSITLILISVIGLIFYRPEGYLLFYIVLITMSLVNLYYRSKKIMILNPNLPANLIEALKDSLQKKEKKLKKEQKLLKDEDAYLKSGRDTGNSEELDEAILEDNQKELTDLKLNSVDKMRLQVRKSLALIKIGKYGSCEVCGNPIDKARLKIYPMATKCIDCASKEK